MVYEIQPNVDWDKGKAVLYLLEALGLDGDDVMPLYLGDDITDEDAFEALGRRGVGIFVGERRRPRAGRAKHRRRRSALVLAAGGGALPARARAGAIVSDFLLVYDGFEPAEEGLREALTSTGNGYFCTRGCAEWEDADDTHYPGTYAHGVYNRRTTVMGIHPVPNEDLVNLPNWLVLKLRIEGDEPFGLDRRRAPLLPARVRLPQRAGAARAALPRPSRPGDQPAEPPLREHAPHAPGGDRLGPHAGELVRARSRWCRRSTAAWSNQGVARYRQLEGRHLDPQGPRIEGTDVIALKARTRQSRIEIAEAARTRVYRGDEELEVARSTYQTRGLRPAGAGVRRWTRARPYGSRSWPPSTARATAASASRWRPRSGAPARYPSVRRRRSTATRAAWDELWEVCDAQLPREERVQFLLRFHTAHLLQVCSRHTAHHDAGVPARGLNGEAYRGHVFWDELFVYPFLNFRLPLITRGLLLYRYRRIAEARAAARESGYRGGDVPLAERQRRAGGDPDRPPQPADRPVGPGPQPQPAPRQRGDLLHRLALPPGHARLRLPARLRRRDDARDRPLLGLDRALQPGARSLGDPRRHGPGRVPREVSRRRRGRPAQQRLHERHGGLDLRHRAQGPGAAAGEPPRRAAGAGSA